MTKHIITNKEFQVISELKRKFGGNIRLSDLYKNYILDDGNDKTAQDTISVAASAEEACFGMTDKQIENLLHEKVGNMHFYAHYDLAQHTEGLNEAFYNDIITKCDDDAITIHKNMKQELDIRIPNFELLIHAIKTVDIEKHSVKDGTFVENPIYAPHGRYVVGNIIFHDTITGQIHALRRWIVVHGFDCTSFAAIRGATTFADCAAGVLKFRHSLDQEIQRSRSLSRNY